MSLRLARLGSRSSTSFQPHFERVSPLAIDAERLKALKRVALTLRYYADNERGRVKRARDELKRGVCLAVADEYEEDAAIVEWSIGELEKR
jgi:hypothetical protein